MLKKQSFQTTYEELKLPTRTNPFFLKGFQTTYEELKRESSTSSWTTRKGFQTTYEELKLLSSNMKEAEDAASRLPMRNWNCRSGTHRTDELFASRLPMRNWNFLTLFTRAQSLDRFQTTYEELKHAAGLEKSKGFSFQTTYEELKPSNSLPTISGWWFGFQTTYEELKPGQLKIYSMYLMASRLPMRNWNHIWHIKGLKGSEASRLPMRNWNICFWNPPSSTAIRFQTTYEELKPLVAITHWLLR